MLLGFGVIHRCTGGVGFLSGYYQVFKMSERFKIFLLVLFLIAAMTLRNVHAETIAATSTNGVVVATNYTAQSCGSGTNVVTVCTANLSCGGVNNPVNVHVVNGMCAWDVSGVTNTYGWVHVTCPAGATADPLTATCSGFTYTCPAGQNWVLNGTNCVRADCTAGQIRNSSTGVCEVAPVCHAGDVVSSGYYDVGDTPGGTTGTGAPAVSACVGNCNVTYNGGSVSKRTLVLGIYHYFANGSYVKDGLNCSTNSPAGSTTPSGVAGSTCAPGQSFVSMGGVDKCLNSATGGETNPNSPAATSQAAATGAAAAQSACTTAANAAGGVGTPAGANVYQICMGTNAGAGASSPSGGGAGGAGAPGSQYAPSDPMHAYCVDHPTATMCLPPAVGPAAATAAALPANTHGSWYVKTYANGIGGVMTANFNLLKTTPLYGLINNIVPTISGTAATGCFTLSIWKQGQQQMCFPSGVLNFLGVCMMLTALFSARSIIFGG